MLSPYALTTVERLVEYLGIDLPAVDSADYRRLEGRINSISNFIRMRTGRNFRRATYTNEVYLSETAETLNLKNYPVADDETFILERRTDDLNSGEWEVVDPAYYTVDMENGIIYGLGGQLFSRSINSYRVTYTAGYDFDNITNFVGDTMIGDLEMAIFLISKDFQDASTVSTNIKSERIGDYSVTYQSGGNSNNSTGSSGMFLNNPQALAIIDAYLTDEFGGGYGALTPIQR